METTDINLRQKDEQIDAGEAMWLMEATGNHLYNRNAKYKHGNENLSLDFELSFKLEQGESKQATVSKNEVLKEVEVLHRTIDSCSSSMSRLPRLVDYEIASIKEGMVNFKVRVVLVNEELRESYDANRIYGLPEVKRKSSSGVNISNIASYDCALNLGATAAPDYVIYATNEVLLNNTIKVYPNPVTNYLIVEGLQFDKQAEIKIYNSLGQLVFNEKVSNNKINLHHLQNGYYTYAIFEEAYLIKADKVLKW